MKLRSILQGMITRASAKRPRHAAARAAARYRRPNVHLEQLEDRTLLTGPGDIEWLRQFGGFAPAQFDFGRAVDADGSAYIAGQARGALQGQTSAGGDDAFVQKYDADGNVLWTRQFGSSGFDQATGIAVDASGVYVAGFVAGALPGQVSAGGNSDAFVRKYDADGNELWTRQFGTAGAVGDDARGISADSSGIYVAGLVSGALPGQVFAGIRDSYLRKYDADGNEIWTRQFDSGNLEQATSITVFASSVYVAGTTDFLTGDVFLRKYDISGGHLWTRLFGTSQHDVANGIAADGSGVYVAGATSGILPGQTGQQFQADSFVRKYDAGGIELWTRQFSAVTNSSLVNDVAQGVAVDASGVYVAGSTGGTLPGQISAGGVDSYLRKYDASGTELWTRQFGVAGVGADQASGVAVDSSGVYVVGVTQGALPGQTITVTNAYLRKFDTSGSEVWHRQFTSLFPATDIARAVDADGNVYVAGKIGGVPQGYPSDAFVSKYDDAGNLLWTRQFGGSNFCCSPAEDVVNGIAVDASGVYVAGSTDGLLPGQTSSGASQLDAFVRKYDTDGNELWTRQFGTGFAESAVAIAMDASGGVYVAGNTNGRIPNQTGGFEPSAGGVDVFVRKYDPAGNALWTRQFGSAGADQVSGVAANASGEVYVTGDTSGALPGQISAGGQDAFVRKYNAIGTVIWTSQFGTAAADRATGIAADGSDVYASGFTAGAFAGQTSAGSDDAFIRKYNTNGSEVWTRQFGSAGADQANGVAVGGSGIYLAGQTGGVLPGQSSAGGQDAFVGKYDASGAALWTRQFGTAATDSATGIAVSASGLYVAGTTDGTFPGQMSSALSDVFVAKIVDTISNTPPSNVALNLNSSVDENGTATLSGSFADPDAADTHTVVINWGPGEDTTTLNLAAGVTMFTASHLYLDDSPAGTPSDIYDINVTVSDASANASGSTSLTVNNLPPTAGISGPSSGLSGDSLVFTLTAIDPSPVDSEAGFTFRIDWDGDGVIDEEVTGPSGMTIAHSYSTPGFYDVRVTAEDKDTGVSDEATIAVDVLAPPTIQGLVWVDSNDDGEVNFGETAIPGVTITLTGIDDLGQSVNRVVQTDANGVYVFANLRPSNADGYTIAETQPAAFPDGQDTLGTVNGIPVGSNAVNDVFSGIVLSQGGLLAENYNFGERPATSGGVSAGQTATIGYWQNRNGQKLIQALNGGPSATQLGHWLAVTFPNMYGALDGKTNAEVAGFYKTLFARTSKSAPGGPPKTDAQVLATAFAVYVTNQTLAGTTAAAYGFQVSATGVGMRTFNVGSNGAAFGVTNSSSVTVLDLLLAVNSRSRNGLLYDLDGDGDANDSVETSYRTMANDVFSGINEAGDI
jgi:hypothetical protein